MLRYLGAIGVWLGLPLMIFALPVDVPVPTCFAMLFLYAGAPLLALVFFSLIFATRKKPQAATALMLVLCLSPLIWFEGFRFGARVHLFVNEGRYAEVIRRINKAKSPDQKVTFAGDDASPSRERQLVTFHYCHCMFYWPDIVYDPAGDMTANRDDLQKLDMYLRDYSHLTTFWYIGYFGD